MKFARVQTPSGQEFALARDFSTDFYLWSDFKAKHSNDKLVQEIESLDQFIRKADSVSDFVFERQDSLSEFQPLHLRYEDFKRPFTPPQFRDFYCFEEHVKNGRKGRGLEMIPEWYEFPVFYYSNHLNMLGPSDLVPYPAGSTALDFELEIGCVVGQHCRDLDQDSAREAIFGYLLVNDWTARDFQKQEMKLNMGPAKGKDFCTSIGPFLISKNEVEEKRKAKGYDIEFSVKHNAEIVTSANWSNISYSFEQMLVRASANCNLFPGELIASGTMGGGCLMEHNLFKEEAEWVVPGDEIELCWGQSEFSLKNKIAEKVKG